MQRFLAAFFLLSVALFSRGLNRQSFGEIVFLDVGQGDGAFVRFADGRSMLVDTGGGGNLVRELAREGILRPDVLLLSHSDRDHAFGTFGLLEWISVGALYMHDGERTSGRPIVTALAAMASLGRVPLRFVPVPRRLDFGKGSVTLFPVRTDEERNGTQLGADIRLGACRFVLLGDMTEVGETQWLKANGGRADVLKVSHHGSRTSSAPALLTALGPRWAVVSSGNANRYGHPVPEVLERFRTRRIDLLRTDFHGAVRFRVTDSGTVECTTSEGSCGQTTCSLAGGGRD